MGSASSPSQWLTCKCWCIAKSTGCASTAFQGGPAALAAAAAGVKERVAAERVTLDEQDVIDGLYLGDLTATPLWKSLQEADSREVVRNFGEQLGGYWNDILGLRVSRDRQNAWVSTYSAHFRQLPLLPVERLLPFQGLVDQRSTVYRGTAVGHADLLFLRPGHPFVDHVRALSDWEDRGAASQFGGGHQALSSLASSSVHAFSAVWSCPV